jgi:tetratricopeptide (TPR) repeat protein
MLTDEAATLESAREALARERLEELQALARTYRNWSVKELAQALGRQPGRLVPESGMPKIDLVVGLAQALDWPVEAVVEHLMKPAGSSLRAPGTREADADFAALYNGSLASRAARDYTEAVRLAVRAHCVADTPTRRAAALSIEASAHEARGSFVEAVRCLREAVRLDGIALSWRLLCDAKLANMLFMQGHTTHALGIASSVIEYTQSRPPQELRAGDREARSGKASTPDCAMLLARALALWTRGNVLRSSIPLTHHAGWEPLAQTARDCLREVVEIGRELAQSAGFEQERNFDCAPCADVLILELDAVVDPACVDASIRALAAVVGEGGVPSLGSGERKAWAAVALANCAKRFERDALAQRGMLEISSAALRAHAVATSNWYFAHRHLQLDAERRRSLVDNGTASRALDATEAKLVAGVLGQIPAARADAGTYFELYAGREGGRA